MRALFLLLVLLLVACSEADSRRTSSTRQAVLGGNPSQDRAVVALRSRRLSCGGDDSEGIFCSGTVIAPRFVLTAAHCVAGRRPGTLQVTFSVPEIPPAEVIAAYPHPAYEPDSGAMDVALLELAAPAAVEPLPLASPGSTVTPGDRVRMVGFGVDDAGHGGVQRSGTARIASVESPLARYEPDPSMTCGGDSGGPVLFSENGQEILVGVTRSGDPDCVLFGTALLVAPLQEDFLIPRLAAAPAVVPPGGAGDFCAAACVSDTDCPASMQCLLQRGIGLRCGFPGLQSGRWGETCQGEGVCGAGVCLSLPGSSDAGCRCFLPCGSSETPSDGRAFQLEGGCRQEGGDHPGLWGVLLGGLVCWRWGRRRRT